MIGEVNIYRKRDGFCKSEEIEGVMGKRKNSIMKLNVATGLHPGITRQHKPNEDGLFAIQGVQTIDTHKQSFGMFVIADGMGGLKCGSEASRVALNVISNTVVPSLLGNAEVGEDNVMMLLSSSIQRANEAIYQHNRQTHREMGTTITIALIVGTTAYFANVGDSRAYLHRKPDGLQQITRDHSVVASLVETGAIAPDDIYTHPERNHIYRHLGKNTSVEVDLFSVSLQAGDTLLLCSDGIWQMIRPPDIQRILSTPVSDQSQIVHTLIETALAAGGKDNISVIIVSLFNGEM